MGAKISGELIGTFNGLRIYGRLSRAKRKGKDRVWIHIRQVNPKKWRMGATLSYEKSIDVRFESESQAEPKQDRK